MAVSKKEEALALLKEIKGMADIISEEDPRGDIMVNNISELEDILLSLDACQCDG
jgi:hypothetical protein